MITAQVDTTSTDMFVRNRVRVVASTAFNHQRHVYARARDGGDYIYIPDGESASLPEGVSPFVLDTSTDVARAVYLALRDHFEPKDAVPVASDRAYSDARQDIERAHALIDKLVDAATRPPIVVNSNAIQTSHLDHP